MQTRGTQVRPHWRQHIGRVGVWVGGPAVDEDPQGFAALVEHLGYGALWIGGGNPDPAAFARIDALLSATSHLVVATGITSIWTWEPAALAEQAARLEAEHPGRFVLGLGVSHAPLVTRLRGHDYAHPLAAMRDYLAAMEAAPMFAPEANQAYARVIAALGPRMLELAATQADGAHTYLVTPEHTARARAALGAGFLVVEQAVVLGKDREEFLRRAHDYLEIYTGLENYRASWRRLGFVEEDFVRGGSARLADAMVVHGDEATIQSAIDAQRDAGADHVALQVLGADLTTPPIDEWRRLATLA